MLRKHLVSKASGLWQKNGDRYLLFARHGRALTGVSPEHAQVGCKQTSGLTNRNHI